MRRVLHSSLLPFVLFAAAASQALAQGIVLSPIDTSGWPTLSARIYIVDAAGIVRAGVRAEGLRILDNGRPAPGVSVECGRAPSPEALSSVLVMDVSGSMAQQGRNATVTNIALARAAAGAWIDGVPDGSEVALTAFDDDALVVRDLTRNRTSARDAIPLLRPSGGTNYEEALLSPTAGAFTVLRPAQHRRVLVFLTDGLGSLNLPKAVERAQEENVTVFCVTLGLRAPSVLRDLAERTGGECFENVTSMGEARAVYAAILHNALGGEPCTLRWTGLPDCGRGHTVAITGTDGASANGQYTISHVRSARLTVSPPLVRIAPGEREARVTLRAEGGDVQVAGILPSGTVDRGLSLEGSSTPFTLRAGEERNLTVRSDGGEGTKVGRWHVDADACVTAGITVQAGRGDRVPPPPIHLIAPNGGERFRPGTEALIGWDGVAPETPVRLDYSIDDGATWRTVAERTSGGIYRWTVPPTPSERCFARVTVLGDATPSVDTLQTLVTIPAESGVYAVLPGGKEIVTYMGKSSTTGREGTIDEATLVRWDLATGRKLATWKTSGVEVHLQDNIPQMIDIDPTGRYALIKGSVGQESSFLVDVRTGRQLWWFAGEARNHPTYMTSTERPSPFSPDGSLVLLSTYKDGGSALAIVETGTKKVRATLGNITLGITSAAFMPDGRTVLTAARDGIALWNPSNGALVRRLTGQEFSNVIASPDGALVAAIGKDNKVYVWESATGTQLGAFPVGTRGEGYRRPRFSPDGSQLVVWKNNYPTLIDARTGAEIGAFGTKGDNGADQGSDLLFSSNGATAVVPGPRTIGVWNVASRQRTAVDVNPIFKTAVSFVDNPDGGLVIWHDQNAGRGGAPDTLHVVPVIASASGTSSDASDNRWAIADARPAAIDVEFGAHPVGSTTDSVVVGAIRNLGTDTLLVSSVSIGGVNAAEFDVISGGSGTIPPGGSLPVELRFAPSALGPRTAEMRIDAGGATLTQRVSGTGTEAVLKLGASEIDFGDVLVGTSREMEATAVVRNEGRASITLNGPSVVGPDTSHFAVLSGGGSFTLQPGESRTLTLRFSPDTVARYSTRLLFRTGDPSLTARVDLHGQGITPGGRGDRWNDPTTFRTIAVPNAVIPRAGSFVAGSYDLLGLMVGYAPLDNVMILAGGAPPLPDDWGGVNGSMFGAYSIGLKVGVNVTEKLRIGGGYQWGRSMNDREETEEIDSRITVNIPYLTASYGDDDSRITATGGYVYKRHQTWLDAPFLRFEEYNADAALASLGGDLRIGDTWKLTAEAIYMGTIGVAPLTLGARLFGRTWALDFAAVLLVIPTGEGDPPSIPVAPLVSYVRVF